MIKKLLIIFCSIIAFSCSKNTNFEIREFNPVSNLKNDSILLVDLDEAVLNGIEVPTKKQTPSGYFTFSFKLKNTSSTARQFNYKIYYQNSSYKFGNESEFAHENFYGSWEDTNTELKKTKTLNSNEEITVLDSFKIIGNPRNERIYYGADPLKYFSVEERLEKQKNIIINNKEWLAQVKEKAVKGKISVDEQIYLDALWSVNYDNDRDSTVNNRWKRNPRMGDYEFMLVVLEDENLKNIPDHIKNISKKNAEGNFENPFKFFEKYEVNKFISETKLKVATKLNLGSGIYIDKLKTNKSGISTDYYNCNCNADIEQFRKANFQQYFHYINKEFTVYNIPEVRDVVGENISNEEYETFKQKYKTENSRVKMYVNSTSSPCQTVKVDSLKNTIQIINPGVKDSKKPKKEHVGISSRIGFTYGKYTAKVKFPKMLSKKNVWNGITNAFWLLYQSENAWNNRRDCNAEIAYIPKSEPDNNEALKHSQKRITYSEIDFEIVKEIKYWPTSSYNNSNVTYQTEDGTKNNEIMVTCTNWDMACHEPKDFSIGAKKVTIAGTEEILHRWDHFYKALSTKIPVSHDEIFEAPYYYFQIDWQPDKIVWKIGTEKNNLRTIAIMDKNISAIPNNQMIIIFTQEWHNQEWWPTAPYLQNFIPFPKKDLIGEILEVTIE